MPKGELKYWVFDQDKLEAQLEAYVADAAGHGLTPAQAGVNVEVIRHFLTASDAGKPLQGGRAG